MPKWTSCAHVGEFLHTADTLPKKWAKLHAGDQEPLPQCAKLRAGWALFHSGEFENAAKAGLQAGPAGTTLANKATCTYARYLEPGEKARLELFLIVSQRAAEQMIQEPGNANAYYWHAYALAHYSQGISVAKALAQGLGGKVKSSLEKAIALQSAHADAHVALGAFHAEVIDKVGALIGIMTYGAKKDTCLKLFESALTLVPKSANTMVEYANALVMLEGEKRMEEATALYEKAAHTKPLDVLGQLDVNLAQHELEG